MPGAAAAAARALAIPVPPVLETQARVARAVAGSPEEIRVARKVMALAVTVPAMGLAEAAE
jgi:hypothetical protein